ncbi:MAG: alpha-E domain-containing protein [Lysobacter sp.]|nr:MAG: alpha-E domain-containing protein [Lysobacter sp.]
MLCRTANDLYWASRHIERAENTARLLDVTSRIAMLPERLDRGKAQAAPWRRALDALGAADTCLARYGHIGPDSVLDHLLLSPENPSSIYSCLRAAREAARAQRVAITSEMYEDLNTSWLEMRDLDAARIERDGLSSLLERVKSRSASFRGVTIGTLGRGEGYHFMQLGVFIERADWSIRLLDVVGSDAELADDGEARDTTEYFQWSALLQSLSAFETYRRSQRQTVSPVGVAELMLLHAANPRSLRTCAHQLYRVLRALESDENADAVRQSGAFSARIQYARIDEIFAEGLEHWLQDAMSRVVRLGQAVHRHFMAASDGPMPALSQRSV